MKGIKDNKTGRFVKNLTEKECFYCRKFFQPQHNSLKFCSRDCMALSHTKNHNRECVTCKKVFYARSMKTKFCSHVCYGVTLKKFKVKEIKVRKIQKKIAFIKCRECLIPFEIPLYRIATAKYCSHSCRAKHFCGEKSPHWMFDRTQVLDNRSRTKQGQYKVWRTEILKRDNYCCRMKNNLCKGILQVHHILPWRAYPDVRYNIDNGITLCIQHHPRKRKDELAMVDLFRKIITTKNV